MKKEYLVLVASLLLFLGVIGVPYIYDTLSTANNVSEVRVFVLDAEEGLKEADVVKITNVENTGFISFSAEAFPKSVEDAFVTHDLVAEIVISNIYVVRVPRITSEFGGYMSYLLYEAKILDIYKGEHLVNDMIYFISLGDVDKSKSTLYTYEGFPHLNIGEKAIVFANKVNPYPGDINSQLLVKNFHDLYEMPLVGFKIEGDKLALLTPLSPGTEYVGMSVSQFEEEFLASISR